MGCLPSKERLTAVNDCAQLNTISSVAPEGEPISREDSGEERTSRADSGGSLSALLELEYFLVKVLFHLVDDGLHECRRVCRLWRKVCSRLPIRIRLGRPAEVRMTAHKFPMAASLVLSRCVSDDDLSMSHAIRLLPRMGNLRSLHLDLHPRRTIPAIIHAYLESVDSLRPAPVAAHRKRDGLSQCDRGHQVPGTDRVSGSGGLHRRSSGSEPRYGDQGTPISECAASRPRRQERHASVSLADPADGAQVFGRHRESRAPCRATEGAEHPSALFPTSLFVL